MEIKVSERKLQKAIDLWWQIDNENAWTPAKHSSAQTEKMLIETFAAVFPESIARRSGNGWSAAGHRVRGDALEKLQNKEAAVMLEAKPCRHKKSADNHMSHLRPLLCLPVDPNSIPMPENVIIVSDSTLHLPGVIYGISCELRKIGCNLLWFAAKGGAGARECKAAWNSAPNCHWGLTVANLNDALKHRPPKVTSGDTEALTDCITEAKGKCLKSHALFINSARFFRSLIQECIRSW